MGNHCPYPLLFVQLCLPLPMRRDFGAVQCAQQRVRFSADKMRAVDGLLYSLPEPVSFDVVNDILRAHWLVLRL